MAIRPERDNLTQLAPDCALLDIHAEPLSLSQVWETRLSALIFVRHLGCSFCVAQVSDLRSHAAEIEAAGLGIALVTPDTPANSAAFAERLALPFLVLADPRRAAYASYGLRQGQLRDFITPRVVGHGAKELLHGNLPRRSAGNAMQLAGTALVSQDGVLLALRPARDVADYLSARDLLRLAQPHLLSARERTRPTAAARP